ncbi:MAG: hypothetical protein FWG16_01415 [Micrococcales bacterium]|nr:hypothetical protein [Micrococcales bacterium]
MLCAISAHTHGGQLDHWSHALMPSGWYCKAVLTKLIRTWYLLIFVGLGLTLTLSLVLVFAKNKDLPLLRSTGLGLLGFGGAEVTQVSNTGSVYQGPPHFFRNVYGFSDNNFAAIGVLVSVIYWVFCLACIAVMVLAVVAALRKPNAKRLTSGLAFAPIGLGFAMVVIAVICVQYPASVFHYSYFTQYYILLAPLTMTLAAAVFLSIHLRKLALATRPVPTWGPPGQLPGYLLCPRCGRALLPGMVICGYCGANPQQG